MNRNGHGARPGLLLKASEHFLLNRNLDGCRKYALQAQESTSSDSSSAAAITQILAVVEVLSAAETRFNDKRLDWYAILGLNRYSQDSQLIRTRFKNLISVLNPSKNKYPFSAEAFELVREAWNVLSHPPEKTQFDKELRIFESQVKPPPPQQLHHRDVTGDNDSFWTLCPYCYYVFEYPRVFEECCLRCQNLSCSRAFQAVPISSPPPEAVVRSGQYLCLGFNPVVFGGGDGRKRFSTWTPFAPNFDEISDDDVITGGDNSGEKVVETEAVKKGGDEGSENAANVVERGGKKRKKSAAKSTKKIMGKGIRIGDRERIVAMGFEGVDEDSDVGLEDGF